MDKCSRPKIDRDKGGRAFSFFYQLQPILFLLYGPIRPRDIDLNMYLSVPPITPEYELIYSPIFWDYKLKKSLIPFIYLFILNNTYSSVWFSNFAILGSSAEIMSIT